MQIGISGLLVALVSSSTAIVSEQVPFDPAKVDLADILGCKIDGGHYVGFTMTIGEEDNEGSAKARGWIKVPTSSPFFSSYRLPRPISVFGMTTDTIAFTGSAMLAVLDLTDPRDLAARQHVPNTYGGSGQFKGERLIDESIVPVGDAGYHLKNRSALQIATNAAFPGKTLIGCSYNAELQPPAR